MIKVDLIELEILYLGIKSNGRFNENDIESSELSKLGVGRILDNLGSLRKQGLVDLNSDGSFSITKAARQILWTKQIPLWVKILRLLQVKSMPIEQIARYLLELETSILKEIELMRKNGLILMSPLRTQTKLQKMYEILPHGVEKLEKMESGRQKPENIDIGKFDSEVTGTLDPTTEILPILDELYQQIQLEPNITPERKKIFFNKFAQIKSKLRI